jgi:hypothetical protein
MQFFDSKFVCQSDGREVTRVRSTGTVRLKLNIVTKGITVLTSCCFSYNGDLMNVNVGIDRNGSCGLFESRECAFVFCQCHFELEREYGCLLAGIIVVVCAHAQRKTEYRDERYHSQFQIVIGSISRGNKK